MSKKLKNNLPLSNTSGQARKRTSTAVGDRNLLRLCRKDRSKSSEILSSELTLLNDKHLSARTVRRRLLTMGYKSHRAKKKPLRIAAHKKNKGFCLFVNINTGVVNGTTSFEATRHISKYSTGRIVRLFVVDNQNMIDFSIFSQRCNVVVVVSVVWGCIAGGARGPLVMYSGKLNEGTYVKVIEEVLPLFIENTFDSSNLNWMFMHDNTPSYRSKYTLKWFENKGIKIIKWPAVSPDFNPIENLWDLIDKKLKKITQPMLKNWNGYFYTLRPQRSDWSQNEKKIH